MKKLSLLTVAILTQQVFADNTPVVNANDSYINSRNFLQDPYISLPSSGGTMVVSESQMATQNFMQKWFADGTWNVYGTAQAGVNTGQPFYEYGTNIFGQTGQVGGFSFGGLFTVINPAFASQMNYGYPGGNQFAPTSYQVGPAEAFVEYQYSNKVQVDVGYIGINNSPWLGNNYYNNMGAPALTYQGGLVNVNAGGGWLLTGLAFNAAQPSGQMGFDGMTLYNTGFDYSSGTSLTNSTPSNGTYAAGASYMGWNNNENFRVWYYNFNNYANLWYADNNLKFVVNKNLSFSLGAQAGTEMDDVNNTLVDNGLGTADTRFYGLQAGFNYEWIGVTLAYNNVWGSSTSFGQGAIVSPYTYNVALDPLFTTPYMQGLVDRASSGEAYKVAVPFTFLDGNLVFTPVYTKLQTNAIAPSQEYDLTASYSIPQIKGLSLFAVYAYQDQEITPSTPVGSAYSTQLFVSYLY